jgi:hypothetical protein
MNKDSQEIKLAHGWPISKVRMSLENAQVNDLASFIKARHRERFFGPIKRLRESPGNSQGYGFAIMALCSLLVETIQSYREGLPTTHQGELNSLIKRQSELQVPASCRIPTGLRVHGAAVFEKFFSDFSSFFPHVSGEEFHRSFRNGLLHQGQTKNGWVIKSSAASIWDEEARIVDRNAFSLRMEEVFELYVGQLSGERFSHPVWQNAARKIWWLAHLSESHTS